MTFSLIGRRPGEPREYFAYVGHMGGGVRIVGATRDVVVNWASKLNWTVERFRAGHEFHTRDEAAAVKAQLERA